MCLVLASHNGHGWEGWVGGTLSCMSFSLWQGKDSGDGCKMWKVFFLFCAVCLALKGISISVLVFIIIFICFPCSLYNFPADWWLKSIWRKRNHRRQRPNHLKDGSSWAVCEWFKGTLYTLLGCLLIWQMKKYSLSLSHARTHTHTHARTHNSVLVFEFQGEVSIFYDFSCIHLQLLQRREYFGQYGKVLKVSMSRTAAGVIQQYQNNTCSV